MQKENIHKNFTIVLQEILLMQKKETEMNCAWSGF